MATLAAVIDAAAAGQVTFLEESFAFDASKPAAGSWLGNATLPPNPAAHVFLALRVEPGEAAGPVVRLTLIEAGALDRACETLTADGARLSFRLVGPGGEFRFDGAVSDDGQRYAGEVTVFAAGAQRGKATRFEFARTPRPLDVPEPLAFTGELEAMGAAMGMSIVLGQTPGGHWVGQLDVPLQMLRGFPVINLTDVDGTITGHLPVPGGASFEVSLDGRRQRMTGTFRQSGMEFPIDFARDLNYAYKEVRRPQEPKPPYPYETREIIVEHPDGFVLAGTLTLPDPAQFGEGPHPVAVLISGSGQQDRDEALLGHKPFLVIADHLTRNGIAVMRFDDRGVGGSGGLETLDTATSADFATDTLAVVNHLVTLDAIDRDHIGLIGHSEGGLIAPLVDTMTERIAFMVLMAGPGVRGEALLEVQRRLLSEAAGMSPEAIERQNAVIREAIAMLRDGASVRDLVNFALKRARELNPDLPLTDDQFRAAARGQFTMLASAWMRYFLDYDPAPALRQVSCRVLALNGTLDLQVWHEQNLDAIERILTEQGVDVTAKRYPGLNHLFQPAKTGAVAEYAQIETTFDETVLRDMVEWIKSKVQ
jgi:hypothetical protein